MQIWECFCFDARKVLLMIVNIEIECSVFVMITTLRD